MRFQTAPAQGLGLQQSRQQLPHLARVAGKHRALKPEQATSSQLFDFFIFVPLPKEVFWNNEICPGQTKHLP